MSRKVKCPSCEMLNDKEIAVLYQNRYYCKTCFEQKQQIKDHYKDLLDYICKLYNLQVPNGWILKQIKEYKEQFNYSYLGMKTTLHYFFEIQGNEIKDDQGVGIIPFVYEEAKQFYIDKKSIKENSEKCDIKELQEKNCVIKVNPKNNPIKDRYKDLIMIDILSIGEE